VTTLGLIGLGFFLAGLIIGKWWLPIVAGIAVFLIGAIFSDLEADPVGFGLITGFAAAVLTLGGVTVRLLISVVVEDVGKRRQARRQARGL